MIIHYCEACGNRVSDADLESGTAVTSSENQVVCAKCMAARAPKMPSSPLASIRPATGDMRSGVTGGTRTIVRAPARSSEPEVPIPSRSGRVAVRNIPATAGADARGQRKLIVIGGIAAGMVVLLAGIFLIPNGSKQPSASEGKGSSETAIAPPAIPLKTDTPNTDTPRVTAGADEQKPVVRSDETKAEPLPPRGGDSQNAVVKSEGSNQGAITDDYRAGYAARLLDDVKKYSREHPEDPWGFRGRLQPIATGYGSSPAGQEAARLLAEMIPPAGQRWPEGYIWREYWLNIGGNSSRDLTTRPDFPGKPSGKDKRTELAGPTNVADNYGARMRGYIHPPTDGNYTFCILADDSGEFWLSDDENAANKKKVAECPHAVQYGQWTQLPAQQSKPIALCSGKRYYFEVLHKEAGGEDFVAVGWQMPNGMVERPISGGRLSPCEIADDPAAIATVKAASGAMQSVASVPSATPVPEAARPDPQALEKTKAIEAKVDYEETLADAYALLAKQAVPAAVTKLEQARSDPKLSAHKQDLALDVQLAKDMESVLAAVPSGATKLDPKVGFELKKTDGKSIKLGAGSKTTVKAAKDGMLTLETDLGGGMATSRVAVVELTPATQYELAKAGLPDSGESTLKLAFVLMVGLQAGDKSTSAKAIGAMLDAAEKAQAPVDKVRHLRERLSAWEREEAVDAEFNKAEALMKDKKWKEAQEALDSIGKEYAGTRALRRLGPAIGQRMAELAVALNPLLPGLWTSYWSGDMKRNDKKFIFGRAETKLVYDWGMGSPDPRVPVDHFGLRFCGVLRIEQDGNYRFKGDADDEIWVWLDEKQVCAKNEGATDLKKDDHEIKIEYQEQTSIAKMGLRWQPPGANGWQEIPAGLLWHDQRLKAQYESP